MALVKRMIRFKCPVCHGRIGGMAPDANNEAAFRELFEKALVPVKDWETRLVFNQKLTLSPCGHDLPPGWGIEMHPKLGICLVDAEGQLRRPDLRTWGFDPR